MIISASRRCDIPSHFGEWFVNRLNEGYILIQNPYNANRLSRALLTAKTVDMIVFWTKNPIPFLKYLPEIDSFNIPYYFEFTLTPYGRDIEKNLPDKEALIEAFIVLSKKLGANRVVWRYDPILVDEKHDIAYHEERFSYMAKRLCKMTNRVVISFVDNYKNLATRMGKDPTDSLNMENIEKISRAISKIAFENEIEIVSCAEKYDLDSFGIKRGACIDKSIIESILDGKIIERKDKNQRAECLCLESIDIGSYSCCANGCSYCYAVQNEKLAMAKIKKHNPKSAILIGEVDEKAIITKRDSKSILINQISLFD